MIQTRRRLALVVVSVLLAACGSAGTDNRTSSPVDFAGFVVGTPFAKPTGTLVSDRGDRYSLSSDTAGRVLLLFYGYTHCKDVCPTTMAHVAAVLRELPPQQQARVTAAFVTTDPDRDTPSRLRRWLGRFDTSIVGLTGTRSEVRAAQQAVGLFSRQRDHLDGTAYTVEHGGDVYAFAPDGRGYLAYGPDASVDDYVRDIGLLLEGHRPSAASAAEIALTGANARIGAFSIVSAFVVPNPDGGTAGIVATFATAAPRGGWLLEVKSPAARRVLVTVHGLGRGGLRVPPQTPVVVDGRFRRVEMRGLSGELTAGDFVPVAFRFSDGAAGTVDIPVRTQPAPDKG